MKYRPHFGSFDAAIAKMIEIEPTMNALIVAIQKTYTPWKIPITAEEIIIDDYIFDEREPWNSFCYIVHIPAAKSLSNLSLGKQAVVGVLGYVSEIPTDYEKIGSYHV
jgi:hypothetical protein